jgi:predicted nucleic acid-binding protein
LIVAFDASVLVYIVTVDAKAPIDPSTGQAVSQCKERLDQLIASLQRDRAKIIIPTPSLAEVLVGAERAGPEFLRIINASRHFRIVSFDERAAVEFAARQAERKSAGVRPSAPTRAKAKFDDQIVAIAAVENATIIYSDDPDIKKLVGSRFDVIGIAQLPLPPEKPSLPLLSLMQDKSPDEKPSREDDDTN